MLSKLEDKVVLPISRLISLIAVILLLVFVIDNYFSEERAIHSISLEGLQEHSEYNSDPKTGWIEKDNKAYIVTRLGTKYLMPPVSKSFFDNNESQKQLIIRQIMQTSSNYGKVLTEDLVNNVNKFLKQAENEKLDTESIKKLLPMLYKLKNKQYSRNEKATENEGNRIITIGFMSLLFVLFAMILVLLSIKREIIKAAKKS